MQSCQIMIQVVCLSGPANFHVRSTEGSTMIAKKRRRWTKPIPSWRRLRPTQTGICFGNFDPDIEKQGLKAIHRPKGAPCPVKALSFDVHHPKTWTCAATCCNNCWLGVIGYGGKVCEEYWLHGVVYSLCLRILASHLWECDGTARHPKFSHRQCFAVGNTWGSATRWRCGLSPSRRGDHEAQIWECIALRANIQAVGMHVLIWKRFQNFPDMSAV